MKTPKHHGWMALALLSALLLAVPQTQAQEKKLIKMAGTAPITHHATKGLEMFKSLVEKGAQGRVQMQIYPANQLYSDKDLVLSLPKGAVEGAMLNPDMWSGLVRSEGILYFPMYYESREKAYKIQETEVWQIICKDFEEKGNTKVLSMAEMGPTKLFSKRPIRNLDHLKGLRTRSHGEYPAVFLQSLGAAPVVMSAGDMYLALQRGTIDAAITPSISFFERKLFEVTKYNLENELTYSTPLLIAFNMDFWKGLPPDLQKLFQDSAKAVQQWTINYAWDTEKNFKQLLKDKGSISTSLDPAEVKRWREKAAPNLEAAYKKNTGEEKGQKIISMLKKL